MPNVAARKKAGTLDKPWDEKVRAKIQTSMLVNRLHDHVFKESEVSQTQMKAIEILLRKSLPDLSAVTLTGDKDNPVGVLFQTVYERTSNN